MEETVRLWTSGSPIDSENVNRAALRCSALLCARSLENGRSIGGRLFLAHAMER